MHSLGANLHSQEQSAQRGKGLSGGCCFYSNHLLNLSGPQKQARARGIGKNREDRSDKMPLGALWEKGGPPESPSAWCNRIEMLQVWANKTCGCHRNCLAFSSSKSYSFQHNGIMEFEVWSTLSTNGETKAKRGKGLPRAFSSSSSIMPT